MNDERSTTNEMRILVHDYAGHAYAMQLSRALARRGHAVHHVYCDSNPMPHGAVEPAPDDPETLTIQPIRLKERIQKGKLLQRRRREIEHGHKVAECVRAFRPDLVISGSAALDTQNHLWAVCAEVGAAPVFWLQDLTGEATRAVLGRKLPGLGAAIGRYYIAMEERLLRQSAAIVAITEDFRSALARFGVDDARVHVVENWGPLEEVPVVDKANAWAKAQGLAQTFNFVYSGTLGMKHNPKLLVSLARAFRNDPGVRVVAVTEGIGRAWLEEQRRAHGLENLVLLDFQPYVDVPRVMGAADVMVVLLEPAAGIYSVPSKTLACLCGGRPVLMGVPPENLAARIVARAEAGLLSDPRDEEAFLENARTLHQSPDLRARLGKNARAYAEQTFDIETIATRFEEIFEQALLPTNEKR